MDKKLTLSPELESGLQDLSNSLAATENISAYLKAFEQFNSDAQAQSIMKELSSVQADLRLKQANNQISAEDLEILRSVQQRAQNNAVIANYMMAQQNAVGVLKEINEDISQLLGLNFASLAKKTSC